MNIGIIGLGLIGGSLGRAIIKKTDHTVFGHDISADVMLKAEMLAAIHAPLTEADYGKLDLLIVALMPRMFESIMADITPKLKRGATVIDIGGNKKAIVDEMRKMAKKHPKINFIATHPMAGREFSGINHAIPSLFEKASLIMVPVSNNCEVIANLKKLFLDLGFGDVVFTDAARHDSLIAYTSQLPHIISSCYIQSDLADEHKGFSAGSFRDLSRVAKMNSAMWTELVFDNREEVIPELDAFISRLTAFKDALVAEDEGAIATLLESGNAKKEQIEKRKRKSNEND